MREKLPDQRSRAGAQVPQGATGAQGPQGVAGPQGPQAIYGKAAKEFALAGGLS